jgi:hypothetical protein
MGRPSGARNKKYRRAARDRRTIGAVARRVEVAHAATEARGRPVSDAGGRVAGVSARHAQRLLWAAMERVAGMSEDERARLKRLPAPAAPGTQAHRALRFRLAGLPYVEIGAVMGINPDTANQYVIRQLERLVGEETRRAEALRQLHLERADAVMGATWGRAMAGDARAATICLRALDRRAKLLGVYAPARVDIEPRLRALAREHGLDEEELIEEGRAIIAREARKAALGRG